MKYLYNWRYYIIVLLFIIGTLSTSCIFSDKTSETTESEYWEKWFIALIVAASSWLALVKCIRYWEQRGEIPEFTDYDEEEDEWS